jgi:hypothetical protein
MYDPTTGRWLCEDPIGFSAEDMNLYRYVGNNPTNETDPDGLRGRPNGAYYVSPCPPVVYCSPPGYYYPSPVIYCSPPVYYYPPPCPNFPVMAPPPRPFPPMMPVPEDPPEPPPNTTTAPGGEGVGNVTPFRPYVEDSIGPVSGPIVMDGKVHRTLPVDNVAGVYRGFRYTFSLESIKVNVEYVNKRWYDSPWLLTSKYHDLHKTQEKLVDDFNKRFPTTFESAVPRGWSIRVANSNSAVLEPVTYSKIIFDDELKAKIEITIKIKVKRETGPVRPD